MSERESGQNKERADIQQTPARPLYGTWYTVPSVYMRLMSGISRVGMKKKFNLKFEHGPTLFVSGNGYIEGTELDAFLKEFVGSVTAAESGPEVSGI